MWFGEGFSYVRDDMYISLAHAHICVSDSATQGTTSIFKRFVVHSMPSMAGRGNSGTRFPRRVISINYVEQIFSFMSSNRCKQSTFQNGGCSSNFGLRNDHVCQDLASAV